MAGRLSGLITAYDNPYRDFWFSVLGYFLHFKSNVVIYYLIVLPLFCQTDITMHS